jgi:hypothetical protein
MDIILFGESVKKTNLLPPNYLIDHYVSGLCHQATIGHSFIPSSSCLATQGRTTCEIQDAPENVSQVFERKKKVLSKEDVHLLKYIFGHTKNYRAI